MSTEPVAAREASQPPDEGIPFGAKLQQLAEQRCDDFALTIIARDGMGTGADSQRR
jgi:bile acid-coenzyme A ligase